MTWRIRLSPSTQLPGDQDISLNVSVSGDTITVNGQDIDLSALSDGEKLFGSDVDHPFVVGIIERNGTEITIPLLFPIRHDAPEAARFPVDIVMMVDGPVVLPSVEPEP